MHAAFLWAIGHEAEPSRAEAIEIWFSEEARIGQKNKITRRWAKRGTRPSAPRDQRTTSTYIFGAVCPKLGKGAALILPACNTEAMNLHLAEIALTAAPEAHAVLVVDLASTKSCCSVMKRGRMAMARIARSLLSDMRVLSSRLP